MTVPPLYWRWEGDAMVPLRPAIADKHFIVGANYLLAPEEERSSKSHRHYFSSLHEIWQSLPDDLLTEYPTDTHLRKKMLIKCGYADERSIVCSSKAEAERMAAFIRPMDEYAVVTFREAVVRVYTAQSQSGKAMGAKLFQESKEKVLDAANELLGIDRAEKKAA